MKITFELNPETGFYCLFDTRSQRFFPNCSVRDTEASTDLLELANSIVRKPYKVILEMAQNYVYTDNGYLEYMIASKYVSLNPDIKDLVTEKLNKPKVNKKMQSAKRGRKSKYDKILEGSTVATTSEGENNGEKKKRGRPKKSV